MSWINKIKALNPVCKAVNEFKREAEETRQMVAQNGKEAIKVILKQAEAVK